ncbi:MAG: radical SAM protein [Bacteroidales bacterium]|nr:radical SAM protein [Bacteroidales bacterium]
MPTSAPIIGIVRHSINVDGDGVCTLVAFHTCTLACTYCLNPQSLTDADKFPVFTPQELLERVKIDDLYFQATGGGVTFGGGEPMLRAAFIQEFRSICPENWKISIETALNVKAELVKSLIPVIDKYYVDIKDMDTAIYEQYTGRNNSQVIENLRILADNKVADKVIIRIPLIPDYNTDASQQESIRLLEEMGFRNFDRFEYIKNPKKS